MDYLEAPGWIDTGWRRAECDVEFAATVSPPLASPVGPCDVAGLLLSCHCGGVTEVEVASGQAFDLVEPICVSGIG